MPLTGGGAGGTIDDWFAKRSAAKKTDGSSGTAAVRVHSAHAKVVGPRAAAEELTPCQIHSHTAQNRHEYPTCTQLVSNVYPDGSGRTDRLG